MTQQDDEQDIQHQFAQLQAEMKRVMAEPAPGPATAAPPADAAADFQRIEQGLDALRRDAEHLRARLTPPAEPPVSADALAALRARTEDSTERLTRAVQRNRDAIDDVALRLEELAARRPPRWPVPLAILLGALAIAAAILLSEPGRTERLIDLFNATVFPPKPHADNTAPPPPEPPPPAAPKAAIAEAPPPPAPVAATAPVPAPVPAPAPPVAPQAAETPAPPAAADPVAVAEPAAPAAAEPPAAHGRIVLRARSESWIEVRNRQGGTLVARLLRDGDSWAVPDQAGLFLSTGNAGGLELLVDGTPAPSLGGPGGVRRDVPLDADLVRAGRYAPDPTARPKQSAASR
jgi:hypothetical protein